MDKESKESEHVHGGADHTLATYSLAAELHGHEADVRAISVINNDTFATASRDRSVRLWLRSNDGEWQATKTLAGHQHFVSALATLPSGNTQAPQGGLASGGHDSIINIWDLADTENPIRTLIGHEKAVVALAPSHDGKRLISGSWDHTARVWEGSECVAELKGHSQAVWAVVGTADNRILTAAADREIKLWEGTKCVKTYTGHSDVVRGLQLVEGIGFLSCDNEGILKLWTFSGECLRTFAGHSSFVYTIGLLPSGDFISGGEDRSVKIWNRDTGDCMQTLMHPSAIWAVSSLPNGDIITAGADSAVRIWSKVKSRIMGEALQREYQSRLESVALSSGSVGELNTDKLPGAEALDVPGTKEGQTLMVKQSSGVVEAYQWSTADTQWVKLGQVVDAVGNSSKSADQGKEYDYVFNVDLGDGLNRKLPYNVTDNPYAVAQQFIIREELSQDFLDTIANFIFENTKGITIGTDQQASSFVDPFTGASRYVPGTSNMPATSAAQTDPFTGAGRYIPSYQQPTVPITAPLTDPFTGAGRYVPPSQASAIPPQTTTASAAIPKHFPTKSYVTFDSFNADAVQKKLFEFADQLGAAKRDDGLSEHERLVLSNIFKVLKETSRYHASSLSAEQMRTIRRMILWPAQQRFPALDILRSVLLHPDGAQFFGDAQQDGSFDLLGALLSNLDMTAPAANVIMALRSLANMFTRETTRKIIGPNAERVLEAVVEVLSLENKLVTTALITLVLNFAVYLSTNSRGDVKLQALSILVEVLGLSLETEHAYRALVAIGTLCHADPGASAAARDLELHDRVAAYVPSPEPKLAQAALEVRALLQ